MPTIDQLYFGESILFEYMQYNVFSYDKIQEFRQSYLKGLESNNMELSDQAIELFKDNLQWYLQEERQYIDTAPFVKILDHIEGYYTQMMGGEFRQFRWYQYTTLFFTYVFMVLAKDNYFRESYVSWINQTVMKERGSIDVNQLKDSHFNRLGYWMATASGKTLLMYAIVYMYCKIFAPETNTFYILVPSDELRTQHKQVLSAFAEGGLGHIGSGTIIDFDAVPLFGDHHVRGKLTTISGATNAKLSPNSVLMIDEAHKGATNEAGAIESLKNIYIAQDNTFLFEFSATFQEAFKAEKSIQRRENIFDYYHFSSIYKYHLYDFNSDGFGKNYLVQNLQKRDSDESELVQKRKLVCGALINYALQLRGFAELEKQTQLGSQQWSKNDSYLERRSDGLRIYKPLFLGLSWKLDDDPKNNAGKQSETTLTAILRNMSYIFSHLDEFKSQIEESGGTTKLSIHDFVNLLTGIQYQTGISVGFKIWYDKQNDEIKLRLGDSIMLINTGQNAKIAERLKEDEELSTAFAYQDLLQSTKMFDEIDKNPQIMFLFGSKKFIEGWDSKRPSTILLFKMGGSSTVLATQILGRGLRLYGIDGDGFRHLNYSITARQNTKLNYLEQIAMFGYDIDEFNKFIEDLAGETYRVGIIKKREYADSFVSYLTEHGIDPVTDFEVNKLFIREFPILQDTIGEDGEQQDVEIETISVKKQAGKLYFYYMDGEKEIIMGKWKGQYDSRSEVLLRSLESGKVSEHHTINSDIYRKTYKEIFGEENVPALVQSILKHAGAFSFDNESQKLVIEYISDMELVTDKFSESLDNKYHIFNIKEQSNVLEYFQDHLEYLLMGVANRLKNYKFSEVETNVSYLKTDHLIDELRLDFSLRKKEDEEMIDLFFGNAPKLILEKDFEDLTEKQQSVISSLFKQSKEDKHIYERLYYIPKTRLAQYKHDIDYSIPVRTPTFSPFELNLNKNEEEKIEHILARIATTGLDKNYDIFYLRNLVGRKGVALQYEDIKGNFAKFYPDFLFRFINKSERSDITVVYYEPKGDGIDQNRELKSEKLLQISSNDIPSDIMRLFSGATLGEQVYNGVKVLGVMHMEY